MKTVQAAGAWIDLGRQGENGARVIRFAREADGTAVLAVQRAGETVPYLKPVQTADDGVWWEVDAADTALPGEGRCELRFMAGERIQKSRVWRTVVTASLPAGSGETPAACADWVQQTAAWAAAAETAAESARMSAVEAQNAGLTGRCEELYAGAADGVTDDGAGRMMTGTVMKTVSGHQRGKRIAVIRSIQGASEVQDGTLQSAGRVTVISTGLNQWNEKWKRGYWSASGVFTRNASGYIASEDPIPVVPGTDYRFTSPVDLYIAYFDAGMGFIRRDSHRPSGVFTPPEGCAYLHLSTVVSYGGNYRNDICVNVSGVRDGDYEPYREVRREIHVTDWFAEGMRQAGERRDELTESGWTRRVGTRPYMDGDEADAALTTDGVTTHYPLAAAVTEAGGFNGTLIVWKEGTLRLETEGAAARVTVRVCEPGAEAYVSAESVRELLDVLHTVTGQTIRMRWDAGEERWCFEKEV